MDTRTPIFPYGYDVLHNHLGTRVPNSLLEALTYTTKIGSNPRTMQEVIGSGTEDSCSVRECLPRISYIYPGWTFLHVETLFSGNNSRPDDETSGKTPDLDACPQVIPDLDDVCRGYEVVAPRRRPHDFFENSTALQQQKETAKQYPAKRNFYFMKFDDDGRGGGGDVDLFLYLYEAVMMLSWIFLSG
ncbi:dicer-like protein 4-like [Dorcoceras hygrometricum]|nr:dicer-like protein 4-like [Dorcoceras hygrometricum]